MERHWGTLWVGIRSPAPDELTRHLRFIAHESSRQCEVCGARAKTRRWDATAELSMYAHRTLCAYHGWRAARAAGIEELNEEWRTANRYAPPIVRPLLVGRVQALEPEPFRAALAWMARCQVPDEQRGYVWWPRVLWTLQQATSEQLAVCASDDIRPLFSDEDAEIRLAAILAAGRMRR